MIIVNINLIFLLERKPMIKLKAPTVLTLATLLMAAPLCANADEFDTKIKEQDQKIESIENNKNTAQSQLATIQKEVDAIESQVAKILKEKETEEKQYTKLTAQITELQLTIEKRDQQIQKQARDVQTNQQTSSLLNVLLESNSLSEALSKTMALSTIVQAGNDLMQAQKTDKENLVALQEDSEKRLAAIEEKTATLQTKQTELLDARLTQEVKINELKASLASEQSQKETYVAQQKEAEKKRQEQLKAIEAQKAKEAAEREKLAVEAAKQQAAAEKAAQKTQTENIAAAPPAPVTSNKPTVTVTDKNTSENTNNSAGINTSVNTPVNTPAQNKPAQASSGWSAPLGTSLIVTSPFGWRANPTGPGQEHHDGIDFSGTSGTPVLTAKAGKVVTASYQSSAGNVVIIEHSDGYYSYYMHLSSFNVSVGQQIGQGTPVGGMGTTGNSTGVHLHFGISTSLWSGFVDPAPLLGL